MESGLSALGWAVVLGFVHIFAAAHVRTRNYGAKWNAGARDTTPAERATPLQGRLERAQANFFETFPLFAAALVGALAVGRFDGLAALGAWLYVGGRAVYLPLYAAGVPYVRTVAWGVALVGIALVARGLF